MKERDKKNIPASIQARLLNHAKSHNENYNALLLRFFQERFLARLGASEYRSQLILKGGFLLLMKHIDPFRPTMDIDLLGVNIANDVQFLTNLIKRITSNDMNDGVSFDTANMTNQTISQDAEYEGLRFTFVAQLGTVKSKLKLDIGFGDAVPDGFVSSRLPSILTKFASPELLHYPLESIIAEKFQAIVYPGFANSRMKDFYDIQFLADRNFFVSQKLKQALDATFSNRKTDISERSFILAHPINAYLE